MASSGEDKSGDGDLYAVLGLNKECSTSDLRNAYKKLALRWHPDRCSASGNSKFVEEAKTKFQAIQQAYSVLSDTNKRFLYDIGIYDTDDDDEENGLGDFLNEMATMMRRSKPCENVQESFEELQGLFVEMFQAVEADMGGFGGPTIFPTTSTGSNLSSSGSSATCFSGRKRGNSVVNSSESCDSFDSYGGHSFFPGASDLGSAGKGGGTRRSGSKQKVSSRHDVSSRSAG